MRSCLAGLPICSASQARPLDVAERWPADDAVRQRGMDLVLLASALPHQRTAPRDQRAAALAWPHRGVHTSLRKPTANRCARILASKRSVSARRTDRARLSDRDLAEVAIDTQPKYCASRLLFIDEHDGERVGESGSSDTCAQHTRTLAGRPTTNRGLATHTNHDLLDQRSPEPAPGNHR